MVKLLKKLKMKNLMRNFTLVVISFLAFSCSDDELKELAPTSISKMVAATPEFSSFSEALDVTGMSAMLDAEGTYTVFVPNDDAFAGILGGLTVQEFYDADPAALENIVKYHIVNSEVSASSLTDDQVIATSLGQNITINLEANPYYPEYDIDLGAVEQTSIYVNEARIFARDSKASNGTVHVINSVLTPGS